MVISGETMYYVGLVLISVSVLATAVAIPIIILFRKKLKKKLENDYGNNSLTI
jgi:hypothetical protein